MGKASLRRKTNRQRYLGRLASEDPKMFLSEWTKRLESWEREAYRRAAHLSGRGGASVPRAFELVDEALQELAACGDEARAIAETDTREAMTDVCTRAVASAVNPQMVRFRIVREY